MSHNFQGSLEKYYLWDEKVLKGGREGLHPSIQKYCIRVMVWQISVYHRKLCPCVTSYMNTLIEITKILSVYELGILECCRHEYAQRLETVDLFLFDLYECLIDQISFEQENPRCDNSIKRMFRKCKFLCLDWINIFKNIFNLNWI